MTYTSNISPDIPRLYTGIAQFAACLMYCFILPRRKMPTWQFIMGSLAFLLIDSVWLILTDHVPLLFWIPCMCISIGLMFLFMYLTIKRSHTENLYTTMKALLLAELMASLEWQLEYFLLTYFQVVRWIGIAILPAVYMAVIAIVFLIEADMLKDSVQRKIHIREVYAILWIALTSFAISNLSFVIPNTPFSGGMIQDIFIIRTMVDLVGLAFVFTYQSRMIKIDKERELEAINAMLRAQYDHYRNYQDTINLINMKYHDLKHQLNGLRRETDPDKRREWIDVLSRELETYKPETQTGNQVLDGVIDQKIPLMRRSDIKFTRVIDGKLLDFMHVTDICTIFGNALDNAIENLVLTEDIEKRLIHLCVNAKKQFVYIEISNYCDHPVRIVDGYPVTTKKDKKFHGFGVKSIVHTAEKYGGSVNYLVENDMFYIKILIPMPQ